MELGLETGTVKLGPWNSETGDRDCKTGTVELGLETGTGTVILGPWNSETGDRGTRTGKLLGLL